MPYQNMYKRIKNQNGEVFAQLIRHHDEGIFDIPDIDRVLKYAGKNGGLALVRYLASLKEVKVEEHSVYRDPFDLLKQAGYNAFYADTLEKQNSTKHLYAKGEELCTFKDDDRFKDYHIIHCVKENADRIKRKKFSTPQREDEYGTSVISIQILKYGGFISIKNRYNHTVDNCDNTFDSNPDNIIKGLYCALRHKYGVDFSSLQTPLPLNYIIINKQIIKFNKEINNTYLGDTFYCKNGDIIEIDKNKEIIIENFIFNVQNKTVKNPANDVNGFYPAFIEETQNKKVQIIKKENGNKAILADGIEIIEINGAKLVKVYFPNVMELGNNFCFNSSVQEVILPNVVKTGNNCCHSTYSLNKVDIPKLKDTEYGFCSYSMVKELNLPSVEIVGRRFCYNASIELINLPNARIIGDLFCADSHIKKIILPKATNIGDCFTGDTPYLQTVYAPMIKNKNQRKLIDSLTPNKNNHIKQNIFNRLIDCIKNRTYSD